MAALTSFIVGLVFAFGLGLGGMTQPAVVVGFLDIFGDWNPALMFVMVGALVVHMVLYRVIRKRTSPLLASEFHVPKKTEINRDLAIGAMLFGAGWGLAGYCPAPAITALASVQMAPVVFVGSMLVGMLIFKFTRPSEN